VRAEKIIDVGTLPAVKYTTFGFVDLNALPPLVPPPVKDDLDGLLTRELLR
jgi:hypothetical protein